MTLKRSERFASLDEGIYGHLTRRNREHRLSLTDPPADAALTSDRPTVHTLLQRAERPIRDAVE